MGFSIGKIAKVSTGKVSNFRKVLDFNPGLSSFILPPQVQLGIKVAGALGIKVPTPEDLIKMGTGKLDKVLGGIRNTATSAASKAEKGIKDAEGLLDKIDWLLWVSL